MEILQNFLVKRQQRRDVPMYFIGQLNSRQRDLGSGESSQNTLASWPSGRAIGLPLIQADQGGLVLCQCSAYLNLDQGQQPQGQGQQAHQPFDLIVFLDKQRAEAQRQVLD